MPCKRKCGGGRAPKPATKAEEEKKVDVKTLKAYKALNKRFGPDLEAKDLLGLAAQTMEFVEGLKKPGRAEERNDEKLYLWFDTNWAKIADKVKELGLLDEEEDKEDQDGQD
jgi:hypothetical protein